ncbi:thiopeptide-type bacteriocin biosynthesis protein [Saccharopolyspora sp. SCSIO 74807]|uniref:thiopeptide-type bacteriocin biosynthesis protein n=1 Tax=Saccharopolyspora sp. SCSIO 74807 TaxID=3118084 RepID=UPI0030D317B7
MNHGIDPLAAEPPWHQVLVHFHDYAAAKETGTIHIGPEMARAESEGLIAAWFFIRKSPSWRLRFQPAHHDIGQATAALIHERLEKLRSAGHIACWTETIYEPETYAFGGTAGMHAAHHLFHADSHHILAYLANTGSDTPDARSDRRRELTLLLCTNLIRAAGQDWYEQGDVWARVADIRSAPHDTSPARLNNRESGLRRLITADTSPTSSLMREGGSLAPLSPWFAAFAHAGRTLRALAHGGTLSRGLRAVLAHHVIFHWNRIGVPLATQCALASTAKTAVLGREERSPSR